MKIRFLLAAAITAAITFSSCKKDEAPVTPGTGNPGTPQSKKLKKITKAEAGITTVYNLEYNTAGKLLAFRSTDNSEYVQFTYDAQGNLTGIENREAGIKNVYAYTYQNNIPVSATFKSWQQVAGQPDDLVEDDVLTYTISNNRVTQIETEMLLAGATVTFNLNYTGANLTSVTADAPFEYSAEFNFGTHKPVFPKVTNYILDHAGFSLQFASANELLGASYDFPGTGVDFSIVTQYTYDSNGYVLTSNNGDAQMVFEYQ